MTLKMRELVERTGTPKSTILYYIKEGLLPEPVKVKPNVHRYPEDFVERIRFIRYLQHHFNLSIEQLAKLMRRGDFDFSKGFEAIPRTLDLLMAPDPDNVVDEKEACERLGIPRETLERWIAMGAIFRREGGLGPKELEMMEILKRLETLDPQLTLVKHYIRHAEEVAKTEVDTADKVLEKSVDRNAALKALLDAALILKPYLFNMHLVETYRESGKGMA
ncbi:MerR family transcriptional regulator [Hydrogenimonas sp.]